MTQPPLIDYPDSPTPQRELLARRAGVLAALLAQLGDEDSWTDAKHQQAEHIERELDAVDYRLLLLLGAEIKGTKAANLIPVPTWEQAIKAEQNEIERDAKAQAAVESHNAARVTSLLAQLQAECDADAKIMPALKRGEEIFWVHGTHQDMAGMRPSYWKPFAGKPVALESAPRLKFYACNSGRSWTIHEASSGCAVERYAGTMKEAMRKANERIVRVGPKKFKQAVADAIAKMPHKPE